MEVATTGHMGEILIAPKFPGAHWSYQLVGLVRAGDTILHWQSDPAARGFVGWSVAAADPEVVPEYTWQPRGTSGRALSGPRTTEGWMVTLGGLNHFPQPPTLDEMRELIGHVQEVSDALVLEHRKPTYFPFYVYGGRELRAQQGYLMKFPVELFSVLPNIRRRTYPRRWPKRRGRSGGQRTSERGGVEGSSYPRPRPSAAVRYRNARR